MSKMAGLGDNLYLSAYDLSGDTRELGRISGSRASLVTTGIDKSAVERIAGTRDGEMAWVSHWNPSNAHVALSSLPTADRVASYFRGTTLGNPAASMVAKQINYDPTRDNAGMMSLAVQCQANGYGLEWGTQHTAGIQTDASAADGTGVDAGGASSYGLQAFLHIFSVGSGTPTVKLQQSSDNGSSDAYADVTDGAFTISSAGAERIATANNQAVEQWLRVVTTGTFTDLLFAVNVVRNVEAVVF